MALSVLIKFETFSIRCHIIMVNEMAKIGVVKISSIKSKDNYYSNFNFRCNFLAPKKAFFARGKFCDAKMAFAVDGMPKKFPVIFWTNQIFITRDWSFYNIITQTLQKIKRGVFDKMRVSPVCINNVDLLAWHRGHVCVGHTHTLCIYRSGPIFSQGLLICQSASQLGALCHSQRPPPPLPVLCWFIDWITTTRKWEIDRELICLSLTRSHINANYIFYCGVRERCRAPRCPRSLRRSPGGWGEKSIFTPSQITHSLFLLCLQTQVKSLFD